MKSNSRWKDESLEKVLVEMNLKNVDIIYNTCTPVDLAIHLWFINDSMIMNI